MGQISEHTLPELLMPNDMLISPYLPHPFSGFGWSSRIGAPSGRSTIWPGPSPFSSSSSSCSWPANQSGARCTRCVRGLGFDVKRGEEWRGMGLACLDGRCTVPWGGAFVVLPYHPTPTCPPTERQMLPQWFYASHIFGFLGFMIFTAMHYSGSWRYFTPGEGLFVGVVL